MFMPYFIVVLSGVREFRQEIHFVTIARFVSVEEAGRERRLNLISPCAASSLPELHSV